MQDCDLTWLHVFPYSPRNGTPAARMPQLEKKYVKARAAALRKLGKVMAEKHLLAQIGKNHSILIETPYLGRTEQFSEVIFKTPQKEGSIVKSRIKGRRAMQLTA